jgi:hypothetical protein
MDRAKALERVHALIQRTRSGTEEESRTCAVIAVRLINEHKLLIENLEPDRKKLHQMANKAIGLWLATLWENRRKRGDFVPVRLALDLLQPPPDPSLRKDLHILIRRRASALRVEGFLIAQKGKTGGFKLAPGIARRRWRAAA